MSFTFWRRRTLSVLTWNVWFGLEKPVRRWTDLLATAGALRADLIAFQEVTEPFLEMLRKAPWVRKGYTVSDPRGDSIASYGSVIVSRFPILRTDVRPLVSEMERQLVRIEVEALGQPWTVATVHLESLTESAETRGRQLEQVFEALEPASNVVLLGDFNFCSAWTEENQRIPPDFVDLWPVVSDSEGFTVDTELNATRARKADGQKRVRFDRILVRSGLTCPTKGKLVGTRRIKGEKPDLFPSDHFGVYGELRLSE